MTTRLASKVVEEKRRPLRAIVSILLVPLERDLVLSRIAPTSALTRESTNYRTKTIHMSTMIIDIYMTRFDRTNVKRIVTMLTSKHRDDEKERERDLVPDR